MVGVILFLFFPLYFSGAVEPGSTTVLVNGNSPTVGEDGVFEILFFDAKLGCYLGIRYAAIAAPSYVWVANRLMPVRNSEAARVEISVVGRLQIVDSDGAVVWRSTNTEKGTRARLLADGNLVLFAGHGGVVWQSFDSPTDTFLPGMNITAAKWLTSWRSQTDPSPGKYSLRLRTPGFGEFELVHELRQSYWSSGRWVGDTASFSDVPEMTIRYIYNFWFISPFTPEAAFGYAVAPPSLSRLVVDPLGTLRQYTWSTQRESWEMFWFRPINQCRIYAVCGGLAFCNSSDEPPCTCPSGFVPENDGDTGRVADYLSGSCRREGGGSCEEDDELEYIGAVNYDGGTEHTFSAGWNFCEKSCLLNCSCVGIKHDSRTNTCTNLYGTLLNLQNQTSSSALVHSAVYLRVPRRKKTNSPVVVVSCSAATVIVVGILGVALAVILRRKRSRNRREDKFSVSNIKVFTYKELHAATGGFSCRLGHGGFGAVFRGELADSMAVAVKRLGRPGAGEREFRAEVRTIGNIHHVNLVRLLGFCCEGSHRLLVYECMEKGSLSQYLVGEDDCLGGSKKNLSWSERFKVAVGTAKGMAYLHEGCRESIIHCDIKPENILLDGEFTAKVSDFGLAKVVGREFSRVPATMRGTWGYVAPEWISGVTITAKADVYSYGMTLLELIAGRRNVAPPSVAAEEEDDERRWLAPWAAAKIVKGDVGAVVDEAEYDREEAERAGMVAVWCVQDEEERRPSMGMVVKMLEGVVPVTVPPPPRLLQRLVSDYSSAGGCCSSAGDGGDG